MKYKRRIVVIKVIAAKCMVTTRFKYDHNHC